MQHILSIYHESRICAHTDVDINAPFFVTLDTTSKRSLYHTVCHCFFLPAAIPFTPSFVPSRLPLSSLSFSVIHLCAHSFCLTPFTVLCVSVDVFFLSLSVCTCVSMICMYTCVLLSAYPRLLSFFVFVFVSLVSSLLHGISFNMHICSNLCMSVFFCIQ